MLELTYVKKRKMGIFVTSFEHLGIYVKNTLLLFIANILLSNTCLPATTDNPPIGIENSKSINFFISL